MKALVVYDSVFGNTEKNAHAIAAVLHTEALPISQADGNQLRGLDLLVVGSPTRQFRPTEAIRKLLNGLPMDVLADMHVTCFDTRIDLEVIDSKVLRFIVDKGGYAANKIAIVLEKKGGRLAPPGEGFSVIDDKGPLVDGELERAADWAGK